MIEKAIDKLTEVLIELKDAKVDKLEKLLEAKASIVRAITLLRKLEEKK